MAEWPSKWRAGGGGRGAWSEVLFGDDAVALFDPFAGLGEGGAVEDHGAALAQEFDDVELAGLGEGAGHVLQGADFLAVDFVHDRPFERLDVSVDRVLEDVAQNDDFGVFAVKVVGHVIVEEITQARVDLALRVLTLGIEEVAVEWLEEEPADEDGRRCGLASRKATVGRVRG